MRSRYRSGVEGPAVYLIDLDPLCYVSYVRDPVYMLRGSLNWAATAKSESHQLPIAGLSIDGGLVWSYVLLRGSQ